MGRFNITAKIWLSVGVFILGYVLSTALGQIQGREARSSLRATSQALFPAAQHSQEAEAAFQRMVKGFSDAVIMQDSGGLDRASEDGRQAIAALRATASIDGLAGTRSESAGRVATLLEELLADARTTYGAVLSNTLTASSQDQMRGLASRTEEMQTALRKAKEEFASDLHHQLDNLEEKSASQNTFALVLFAGTLVVAGAIVHVTIRRSITGPVLRVIDGVQGAANEAAEASNRMARSGQEVSTSAQEQAACVEETSASLEEISATTRQNAELAGEADRLMHVVRQTVERAAQAMGELTQSMDSISASSSQVAGVLKTIDGIAFQTNILALNAAVEAARAGQAGGGFSVVADEVRTLAHRSAEAARNSSATIEKTLGDVSKGVELVRSAYEAFRDVSSKIASGTQIVSQIASSSDEQARGVANVGQAITRIGSLTQKNASNAHETAEAALTLNAQAENTQRYLEELVAVVGL